MLKRKLSLILCSLVITGCFTQTVFADEIKNNKNVVNKTETLQKDTKLSSKENTDKDKKDLNPPTNPKDTKDSSSVKENSSKINFNILSAKVAFDTDFHNLSYQQSIMNKCLNQQTEITNYIDNVKNDYKSNVKFNTALANVIKTKAAVFKDGYLINVSNKNIENYSAYIKANPNLSKDALKILNEYKQTSKNTISYAKNELKNDTALFNKYLKQARSCETTGNKHDLENLLIASIMQQYCSNETKKSINYFSSISKPYNNALTKMIKSNLNGKQLTITKNDVKTTTHKSSKSDTISKNILPKTGGIETLPITSLALITSGTLIAITNKIKRH